MDYRRAGLFRQHQQRRRRPVLPSWWLLRSGPQLLRSRRRCPELLCSGRRSGLCSRRCPQLLRPGCSVLLCSEDALLQAEEGSLLP